MLTIRYCSSCYWESDRYTALDEPGVYTCAEHRFNEECIRRVIQELEEVGKEVNRYASTSRPHPDEAKALEKSIQCFFNSELRALGLECSSGFREIPGSVDEELDVVVAVEPRVPEWSATAKIYYNVERLDLAMHMEVTYRSKGSHDLNKKTDDMVDKINRTVDSHIERGVPLPWTGIILLGDGWISKHSEVMRRVCKQYHSKNVKRITLRNQDFWPYIDAIVLPSYIYKKHDLFLTEQCSGERWPALLPLQCGAYALRPLAIARAFLIHRVKVLRGDCQPESDALPKNERDVILGPDILFQDFKEEMFDSFCIRDCPADIKQLWHQGADRQPMPFKFLAPDKADYARYQLRLDSEHLQNIFRNDILDL